MQDDNPNVIQPNQSDPTNGTSMPSSPVVTPPTSGFNEPPKPPFMPTTQPAPTSRKRLWLLAVAVVIVLGLAAGYVFAFYLPAQPGNMYKSGLTNTSKAIDTLIQYSGEHKASDYKSASFTGSAQVKSAQGSFDFDTSGSIDQKSNMTATFDADIMGQKIQANVRSVIPKKGTTPDIYFQVNKADKLLGQYGLQKYNEKWITIDHTVLDTFAKNAEDAKDKTTPEVTTPTYDQVRDVLDKVQALNKQYLFTTDEKYAVLKDEQFVAKEQVHARTSYHYKVAYNKDHLKTYVAEMKKALDTSKLNAWSESVNHKKLSEQVKFDKLEKEIADAKSDYKFDLWVDAKTRVIGQLQFTDPKDSSSKMTIGQNYTGGDQYPFSFAVNDKDDHGHPESANIGLTLDKKTQKTTVDITGAGQDETGKSFDITGSISVTPSTQGVAVTAPKNSTPINDVINDLFGGIFANPGIYTDDGQPALGSSI